MDDMETQGRINSPRTIRSYRDCLDCHGDDVDNRDARLTTREDVKRTLRRWHGNTQSNRRSVLVSFYDWMMEEGYGPTTPLGRPDAPNANRRSSTDSPAKKHSGC
jgi:site-specific recombinase XerD